MMVFKSTNAQRVLNRDIAGFRGVASSSAILDIEGKIESQNNLVNINTAKILEEEGIGVGLGGKLQCFITHTLLCLKSAKLI